MTARRAGLTITVTGFSGASYIGSVALLLLGNLSRS